MSRRPRLENGEALLVSVTPVPEGLIAPLALLILLEGILVALSMKWSTLHRYEALAIAIVGALPVLVVSTRSWRWRSQKIILTSQRVVVEGGVLGRHSTQVYLADVFATHADQTFTERLRRRGAVLLETRSGTVMLGPVRHPMALRRLVDRTRRDNAASTSRSWEEWFDDPRPER